MSLINREDLLQTLGITDMDCEKCGWYSRTARRCKRGSDFEDACCAIDDAPEVKPEPKWTPCSERLPETPSFCLVTTDGSHNDVIDIALYMSDGWHKASKVLAWMPLPEPYKEEEDE